MLIWLDTANLDTVQAALDLGILFGITTNPNIIAESGKPLKQLLGELLNHQDGPLAVQVIASEIPEMIKQGKELYDFSERIIVKIPATSEGLEVIHTLSQEGIPTMATAVFLPYQAFLASMAGANFIAPYLSHIEKSGKNPKTVLESMMQILKNNELNSEILAASINSIELFQQCAEMGIPHITVKDSLFSQLIQTPQATQEWVNKFSTAWETANLEFKT